MHVKKGDLVQVIAGKDKGKQGKILKVYLADNRVEVEGIQMITKHLKPSNSNPEGTIIKIEGKISASNVMLVDPKTKKPTRVRKEVSYEMKDNKKVKTIKRIAIKSGSEIKNS